MNNWMSFNKESRKQLKMFLDFVIGSVLGDDLVQSPPHISDNKSKTGGGKNTRFIQGRTGTRTMSLGSLLIALCVYAQFHCW